MKNSELIKNALEARRKAYVPYSEFRVGACLLTEDEEMYTGCNIENAAYTPTNCAERTAFFKAVSEGKRNFSKIAIVGGKGEELQDYCPPCGVCLQIMMEFCRPDTFEVILGRSEEDYQVYLLKDLLPKGFGPGNLNQK